MIKEETAALKGHLAIRKEETNSKNAQHNHSTYEDNDTSLQNPRYSHDLEVIDPTPASSMGVIVLGGTVEG